MTVEQTALLRQPALEAYELDAFRCHLTQGEANIRDTRGKTQVARRTTIHIVTEGTNQMYLAHLRKSTSQFVDGKRSG
jgi:hypothetical protein